METPSEESSDEAAEPTFFDIYFKWVKKLAFIGSIGGGIVGVLMAILLFSQAEGLKNLRGVLMLPVLGFIGTGAMITGMALLFAPSNFFTSEEGQAYLEIIGTKSVTAARAVVLAFLLIGAGFCAAMITALLGMFGML